MKKKFIVWLYLLTCITCTSIAQRFKYLSDAKENIPQLQETVEREEIQYIDFIFSDLNGAIREIVLPIKSAFLAIEHGLMFDGSSVPGCSRISESDMHLKPDLTTLTILPWSNDSEKTARIICDIYLDEDTPYEGSPRYVLKKVLQEAYRLGYDFYVGPELEFFLFKKTDNGNIEPIDSMEYCSSEKDIHHWMNKKSIVNHLQAQNIAIEKFHHEVAPGQHELVLHYDNALTIADNIIITRHNLTILAPEADMIVSFMPKPLFGQNGSAMHVHFSLFDLKRHRNAFALNNHSEELSDIAKHFFAGVLRRVHSATALLNPCVNSYKRLIVGYEAPVHICWARKNRSALLRIPSIPKGNSAAVRAELRSPDAASNPYLVFAFILKAGLEGIKNKEHLPEAIEHNVYTMTQEERNANTIISLPASFEHALQAFKQSSFVKKLLGEQLVDQFVTLKECELRDFNQAVTDWELKRYL